MKKLFSLIFIIFVLTLSNIFCIDFIIDNGVEKYGFDATYDFLDIADFYNDIEKYRSDAEYDFLDLDNADLYNNYFINVNALKDEDDEHLDYIIISLNEFIAKYPNNYLILNAYYLIGESYVLKSFIQNKKTNLKNKEFSDLLLKAIFNYEYVISLMKNPNSYLALNAKLRIAEAYLNLNDFNKTSKICSKFPSNYWLKQDFAYLQIINYIKFLNDSGKYNKDDLLFLENFIQQNTQIYNENSRMALGFLSFILGSYDKAIECFKTCNSNNATYFLARCYTKKNQDLFALGENKKLIDDPVYANLAALGVCENLYNLKDYKTAISNFLQFQDKYQNDIAKNYVNYKIACCYINTKDYLKSIEYLSKINENAPGNIIKSNDGEVNLYFMSLYLIGYSYYELKRYDEASVFFEKAANLVNNKQTRLKINLILAWIKYIKNDFEKAENILENSIKSDVSLTEVIIKMHAFLADLKYQKGDLEAAKQDYKAVVDKSSQLKSANLNYLLTKAFFMLNYISYNRNEYNVIATDYQFLLNELRLTLDPKDKNSKNIKSYFIIADTCYRFNYFKEAKNLFSKIANVYIKDDLIYVEAINGLAWCELKEKNYEKAIEYKKIIQEILTKSNTVTDDLKYLNSYDLANLYFMKKDYLKAIEFYEYFLKISPIEEYNISAYLNLGNCYYMSEYYSEALNKWQEAIKKYPNNKKSLSITYKVADTYYKSGKYAEAIEMYKFICSKYDKNIPEVIDSKLRIAQSYYNNKKYDQAITEFLDFIKQYPATEKTSEAITQLESTLYKRQEYNAYLKGLKTVQIKIAEDFETAFRSFIQANPKLKLTTSLILDIGTHYFEEGEYEKAIPWLQRFLNSNNYSLLEASKLETAIYYISESYYFLKNYSEASRNYQIFITNFIKSKNIEKAYIRLGTSYFNLKMYDKCIHVYEQFNVLFPKSENLKLVAYNLGLAYRESDDIEKSCLAFLNFYKLSDARDEDAIQVVLEVVESYANVREYNKAIEVLRFITPYLSDEKRIYAQYKIADCYEKQFKTDKTIEEYSKLLSMAPKENTTRLSGLVKLAEIYENKNMKENADSIYREILLYTTNKDWIRSINARLGNK